MNQSGAIEAVIRYVVAGETAVFHPAEREKSYWPAEEHRMRIENMRGRELKLETNGFALLRAPTALQNFHDPGEIRNVYYPEISALARRLLGAEKVIVFGEVARCDRPGTPEGALPAYGAHVDYGAETVRSFVEELIGGEEARRWLGRRHVLMNLWRPIRTVQRTPLALCDASTVIARDLNPSEVRGGLMDSNRRTLHGFNLSWNPQHRWYYAPQMRPDEVLAFKLFDSDRDRVQWTGHTAFDDPSSAADAPPRESIEVRTISFLPTQA